MSDVSASNSSVTAETNRAEAAETAETSRAEAAESALTSNLAGEVTRATGAEGTLTTNLATTDATVAANATTAKNYTDAETNRATTAEGTLTTNLTGEVTRAEAAEQANTAAVNAEALARQSADTGLSASIASNSTAIGALQTSVGQNSSDISTLQSNVGTLTSGKANLAGGNAFTGNQTISGSVTANDAVINQGANGDTVLAGQRVKDDGSQTGNFINFTDTTGTSLFTVDVNGNVTGAKFTGDGSLLTGVQATTISSGATILGSQVSGDITGNAASITGTILGSQVTTAVANATNATNATTAANLSGSILGSQVSSAVANADNATNATTAANLSGTITGSQVTTAVANATTAANLSGTITGDQVTTAVANATNAVNATTAANLTGNIGEGQVTSLKADLGTLAAGVANAVPSSAEGAANGVATLDSGAKVPAGELPSLSGTYVDLTTDQTVAGNKTFTGNTVVNQSIDGATALVSRRSIDTSPTGNFVNFVSQDGATQLFWVDVKGNVTGAKFTGDGSGLTNLAASTLTANIDESQVNNLTADLAGKASLSGSYADPAWITSLAGTKVTGNISGNAGTVTNGVYATGSYADPVWITSLAGTKVTGNISGNAANITATSNGTLTTLSALSLPYGQLTSAPAWNSGTSTLTGNISGNAATATSATTAGSATSFSGSLAGDVSGTQSATVLASVGAAGTYTKVTTDAKGRVTSGTTLSASDVSPNGYAADSGVQNAAVVTLSPVPASLAPGLEVHFMPKYANSTTTPTLNVNGLGAKTITKLGTTALAVNDLTTTAIAKVIYDGTYWQLENPQTNESAAGTVTGSGLTSGNVITGNGGSAIQDSGTALTSLAPKASPTFTGTITTPLATGVVTSSSGALSSTTTPTLTLTNATGLPLTGIATQAANTVVANVSSSTASPTAAALPTCSTTSSVLQYTLGTGFSCNTGITANSATTATTANGLATTTSPVVVSAAAAPSAGQVLTATSATAASWAAPTAAAGVAAEASVATAQTRSNTAYGALTTAGPAVTATITSSGKALVMISSLMQSNTDDDNCLMGYAVSGNTTIAASDTDSIRGSERSNAVRLGATYLVTGLTAGSNTFTAQYRSSTTNTCTFTDRNIVVIPWPF